jgi:hypothetical protein
MSALRMFVYCAIVVVMYVWKAHWDARPRVNAQLHGIRNMIDALGLVWFVVGNMWLFGDDEKFCARPNRSPVYSLCVSMVVINYIQICLPCIIAALMIPIFCFCMPCLIRVIARLNNTPVIQVSGLRLPSRCIGWFQSNDMKIIFLYPICYISFDA